KTSEALRELARTYGKHLEEHTEIRVEDLCYTASVARSHFDYRLAIQATSVAEICQKLRAFSPADARKAEIQAPGVAFLFVDRGQTSTLHGELYASHAGFRRTVDRCAEIFGGCCTEQLRDGSDTASRFVFEYSLAELWRSWGVNPRAVWGEGVGEIVAACVSG